MAFSDKPRTPGKARASSRPAVSLKMQAIAFLSRREHSRLELRAKLLSALRRREREEAAQAAAAEAHARNVAEALRAQPANGIDDAFAPRIERLVAGGAEVSRSREPGADAHDLDAPDPETVVDQLLDWLAANGYLSDVRFVESRVNARSRKQGATLIRHELARHGLELAPEQAAALRETEFSRAQAIWQRKFRDVAVEPRERAKQARFLAARGFASDVVRRIVGGEEES